MNIRVWSPYLANYRQCATIRGEIRPGRLRGVTGKETLRQTLLRVKVLSEDLRSCPFLISI
jgi:hypothetical protein